MKKEKDRIVFYDENNIVFEKTINGCVLFYNNGNLVHSIFPNGNQFLYDEKGKSFDFDDLTFQFKYDIASFLKYSPFTLTWLSYITGINKKQLSHYSTGVRHPSKPTLAKIQDAVITFAKDYEQVSFVELG